MTIPLTYQCADCELIISGELQLRCEVRCKLQTLIFQNYIKISGKCKMENKTAKCNLHMNSNEETLYIIFIIIYLLLYTFIYSGMHIIIYFISWRCELSQTYLLENVLISLGGTCMCRVECADNIWSGSGITPSS